MILLCYSINIVCQRLYEHQSIKAYYNKSIRILFKLELVNRTCLIFSNVIANWYYFSCIDTNLNLFAIFNPKVCEEDIVDCFYCHVWHNSNMNAVSLRFHLSLTNIPFVFGRSLIFSPMVSDC